MKCACQARLYCTDTKHNPEIGATRRYYHCAACGTKYYTAEMFVPNASWRAIKRQIDAKENDESKQELLDSKQRLIDRLIVAIKDES